MKLEGEGGERGDGGGGEGERERRQTPERRLEKTNIVGIELQAV